MTETPSVVLVADETATWEICGLRQLDRLLLLLNEWALKRNLDAIEVALLWQVSRPKEVAIPQRALKIRMREISDLTSSEQLSLSTRFVFRRNELELLSPHQSEATPSNAYVLHDRADVACAERWLLQGTAKPQDGFASRYLNRRMSRAISRLLSHTRTTPNEWNLTLLALSIAGAFLIAHGGYAFVVVGLSLFAAYSILDGCDGELARVKFLESERGAYIDDVCDSVTNILLLVTLGIGLRSLSHFYAAEGVVAAILVCCTDFCLTDRSVHAEKGDAIYERHRELLQSSVLLRPGRGLTNIVVQLTKRDMAAWFFLLLGILDYPAGILHISLIVAAATTSLGLRARLRASAAPEAD
jgi:phosphatidylglycerophosphate synthase